MFTITKEYIGSFLIAFLLIFVSGLGGLRYVLIPNDIVRGGFSLFLLLLVVYYILKARRWDGNIFILQCGMLFAFLYHSAYIREFNLIFLFSYIVMLGICLAASHDISWAEIYLQIGMKVYLFFAVCTIAFLFLPDFYLNCVVELFPETKERLIEWYYDGCMAGLTEHYSTNGIFMATGCIMAMAFFLKENVSKKRWCISIGLCFIALFLTGKRAHIVFVLLSAIVVYFFWLSNNKRKRLAKMLFAVLLSISVFLLVLHFFPELGVVFDRFKSVKKELSADGGGRGTLWFMAIRVFLQNPILGIGWGNFRELTYGKLKWAEQAHTHNTYLQLLAETGVVGFAVYMGWFIYMFWIAIKEFQYMRRRRKEDSLFLMTFSLGYQVFFCAYCVTGNPLYQYETYIPYFAACAIAIFYHKRNQRIRFQQL